VSVLSGHLFRFCPATCFGFVRPPVSVLSGQANSSLACLSFYLISASFASDFLRCDSPLLPAQHVTPFVRGNKSDHNDVVGIAEAHQRPHIRPVPIKTVDQQDIQSLHRIRERLIKQRTAMINQTRGLLSEHGATAPQGHKAFITLLHYINQQPLLAQSPYLKIQLLENIDEYHRLTQSIDSIAQQLADIAKQNPLCQLLLTIPGVGIIISTLLYSAIGDGSQFANARELAVWLGLTPRLLDCIQN
ncbi:MAG: IS110 family transposase, partial [Gammaproteobacteria bacterium]|nr:IS110 family transposase [Gammaproteobacteria bacterium]